MTTLRHPSYQIAPSTLMIMTKINITIFPPQNIPTKHRIHPFHHTSTQPLQTTTALSYTTPAPVLDSSTPIQLLASSDQPSFTTLTPVLASSDGPSSSTPIPILASSVQPSSTTFVSASSDQLTSSTPAPVFASSRLAIFIYSRFLVGFIHLMGN
ncbi:hypothetical protein PCASD_00580 [Puccinia coronata f. sp. avenae]|uniref:Uncharacterized protein n=1 Tax=Puccinia coronata f. sp. avenae TaxID=200324 RepID=A0A2N5VP05_9BASI|nr:hypothetical protein PCASD_00580 [Puccinia coronata f. sp. avenae]